MGEVKQGEFKDTEIGRIPKEWGVVRLGDKNVSEIRSNKIISGFDRVAFIPMELIPDSNIFARYEVRSIEEVRSFTYCERGDLLLAKITPSLENGKQGLVPDDVPNGFALATTEVFPISCKGIDKLFLFYILKFPRFRNKIIASMIGTTGRQRASKESVENLLIPLPPLPEQRKIAEILSTVDQAIQKVDEAIARTERLKRGLMQRLLTRGIGHREFKDTEIGRIPKEWEVVRLGDVISLKNGERPQLSEDGSFPVYGANGIMGYSKNYLVDNDFTIIIGRVGASGEVHLGSGKIWVSDNAIYSEKYGKDRVHPPWLYHFLKFKQLSHFATKTTHPIITQSFLNSCRIPLPPLPEQRKIAEILSTVDKKLELERKRKEKLERIKKGLMNELLTGRKRVGVVRNE
ncbi:MAG: restriction endonuclease subunit S [Candidatus Hadarchaeales archaeon]